MNILWSSICMLPYLRSV